MFKHYVFYNPIAGCGHKLDEIRELAKRSEETFLFNVTKSEGMSALENLDSSDKVTVCGGDGTLNRFLNLGIDFPCDVYYYPSGTGNDFMREVREGMESSDCDKIKPVKINGYINDLPTVRVKAEGKNTEAKFINGVGYGIDGYCCEEGDAQREAGVNNINYTSIAIKGLLFHYKPTGATVTVDGREYRFEKVWLAPVMKGKYYGGGMIPTPSQKRDSGELSVLIFHGSGKLRTLMIFPSIFKGEHIKREKYVTVLSGKEISVKYDSPRPLQIDGETVRMAESYEAWAKCTVTAE